MIVINRTAMLYLGSFVLISGAFVVPRPEASGPLSVGAILATAPHLAYDTVDMVSDRIQFPSGATLVLQARTDVFQATENEMRVGRVLGRILNTSSVYASEYSLPSGDSAYVYTTATSDGDFRMALALPGRDAPLDIGIVKIVQHPGFEWHQSFARWRARDGTFAGPWFTCSDHGCCKVQP